MQADFAGCYSAFKTTQATESSQGFFKVRGRAQKDVGVPLPRHQQKLISGGSMRSPKKKISTPLLLGIRTQHPRRASNPQATCPSPFLSTHTGRVKNSKRKHTKEMEPVMRRPSGTGRPRRCIPDCDEAIFRTTNINPQKGAWSYYILQLYSSSHNIVSHSHDVPYGTLPP